MDRKNLFIIGSLKRIIGVSFFCLFFFFFSISSYAAKRYTFKLDDNEKYIFTVEKDSLGNNVIIDSYNSIGYNKNKFPINESSFYRVMKERYTNNYYEYYLTNDKVSDSKEGNVVKIIKDLLTMYVSKEVIRNPGTPIKIIYSKNTDADKNIIISGVDDNIQFLNGYDSLISELKDKKIHKSSNKNPYFRNVDVDYSRFIMYEGKCLSDLYSDLELIIAYENYPNKSELDWITSEDIVDTNILVDNTKTILKKENSEIYLYLNKDNVDVCKFLISEYNSTNDTWSQKLYSDESLSKKITADDEGIKCISSTSKGGRTLYYSMSSSQRQTIEAYSDYIAMPNMATDKIDVYKKSGDIYTLLSSVSKGSFSELYSKEKEINIGGYSVTSKNGIITVTSSDGSKKYVWNFAKRFDLFNDSKEYFDFSLAYESNGSIIDYIERDPNVRNAFFKISTNNLKKDYTPSDIGTEMTANELYKALIESGSEIYLSTLKQSGKGIIMGDLPENKFKIENCFEQSADDPEDLPIKQVLLLDSYFQDKIADYKANQVAESLNAYAGSLVDNKELALSMSLGFLKFLKPIMLFLIFLFIVSIGIQRMAKSTDAKERIATYQKLKYVIYGGLVFVLIVSIAGIIIGQLSQSFDFIQEIKDEIMVDGFGVDDFEQELDHNIILEFFEIILRIVNLVMQSFNDIIAKTFSQTGEGINFVSLIYDSRNSLGEVSSFKPFDEAGVEWTRYMSGYKALVSVSLFLILVALIKLSFEFIFYASNEKKIVEIKETFSRMFYAVLIMLIAPFGIRVVIYVFNLLTALLPVNHGSAELNLSFKYSGILGAIIDSMYISMMFKVYFVFLVRKLIISLLLVSTPIVAGLWAISDKFQSIHIWFGELVSNIATQFAYALGFLIVIMLSYEGQASEYGLILVLIALKLAKFVKDSMQGLFEMWGGINEENVGQKVAQTVKGYVKKGTARIRKAGSAMISTADFFDKDGLNNTARHFRNAGSVLSGNLTQYRTKEDLQKYRAKDKASDMRNSKIDKEYMEEVINNYSKSSNFTPEQRKYLKDSLSGKLENQRTDSQFYNDVNTYIRMKEKYEKEVIEHAAIKDEKKALSTQGPLSKLRKHMDDGTKSEIQKAYARDAVYDMNNTYDEYDSGSYDANANPSSNSNANPSISDAFSKVSVDDTPKTLENFEQGIVNDATSINRNKMPSELKHGINNLEGKDLNSDIDMNTVSAENYETAVNDYFTKRFVNILNAASLDSRNNNANDYQILQMLIGELMNNKNNILKAKGINNVGRIQFEKDKLMQLLNGRYSNGQIRSLAQRQENGEAPSGKYLKMRDDINNSRKGD